MRIAVLAPTAAPALIREAAGAVGGAERQIAALGAALRARGHVVDIMVAGDSGPPRECPAGRVWPRYPLGGVPLIKLIHPKSSALRRFLLDCRAGALLQRGAAELTGLGAFACRRVGIPFIFMVASNRDLQPGREIVPHPQDHLLYRAGLRRAAAVVAQTEAQVRRLRERFGIAATLIPSFPAGDLPAAPTHPAGEAVLWGGNLRPVKRPEWLLALAERFATVPFIVYGGAAPGHEAYARGIAERLAAAANIEYLGPVAPEDLPGLFRRARVFLNTSQSEGFPNTFLEAWRQGMPVLSTVDPDGLLSAGGLGAAVRDLAGLETALTALLTETPAERLARADRALSFLKERHDPAVLADRWEGLLTGLINRPA
ncbi:MAG: glycosyltransferase family 4 protein [Candidatus Krumholzibacteriota bacterium]|nr:glycosyltransferase family 4 protein [Candidatus Krumholzibacteriota bacterium]